MNIYNTIKSNINLIHIKVMQEMININQDKFSNINLPVNCFKIDFSSNKFDIHCKNFSDNFNLLDYSFFNLINLTNKPVKKKKKNLIN